MPTIEIRKAGPDDIQTVASLAHDLLVELSDGDGPEIEAVTQSTAELLNSGAVSAFIAFKDDQPVGVITLNECAAIYAGGRFGEISELYVHPNDRSLGIAPQLITAAVDHGISCGWKRLEVGAPDQPAWKRTFDFYVRNDFTEVGPRLRLLI